MCLIRLDQFTWRLLKKNIFFYKKNEVDFKKKICKNVNLKT